MTTAAVYIAHVLIERSPDCHIHELRATADREHRLLVGQRPAHEQQLRPIARRIDASAE